MCRETNERVHEEEVEEEDQRRGAKYSTSGRSDGPQLSAAC